MFEIIARNELGMGEEKKVAHLVGIRIFGDWFPFAPQAVGGTKRPEVDASVTRA
jgi:hypothetical protein